MDTIFATLVCFLLAFSFAAAQTDKRDLNVTVTPPTTGLNLTHTTSITTPSNSTTHVTVISNQTDNTTSLARTTRGNETTTKNPATTTEGITHLQTTPSTTIATPRINLTSPTTASPGTNTPTFTALTTASAQTTGGGVTPPDTTVKTTASSSHTVNTTSDSMFRTKQGLGLNSSEANMTIVFSVVLGVFAVVLILFMFQRCKHRIQYLPQPLTNTDDADGFVTDEDTLVISGGLYDGHPIYDNVPTAPEEQSQFRLEFLH